MRAESHGNRCARDSGDDGNPLTARVCGALFDNGIDSGELQDTQESQQPEDSGNPKKTELGRQAGFREPIAHVESKQEDVEDQPAPQVAPEDSFVAHD